MEPKASPFPPSVEERLNAMRAEFPDLDWVRAANRVILAQDEKICELTAQLNEARFLAQARRYLLLGGLVAVAIAVWWVLR